MRRPGLILLIVLCLVSGGYLLVSAVLAPESERDVFKMTLGLGAEAQFSIPRQSIMNSVEQGRAIQRDLHQTASWLELSSTALSWLGFVIMSVVTIVTAMRGDRPARQDGEVESGSGRSSRSVPLVPVLAAMATVSVGAADRLSASVRAVDERASEIAEESRLLLEDLRGTGRLESEAVLAEYEAKLTRWR